MFKRKVMVVDQNGNDFYENGGTNDDYAFKVILIMIIMVNGHDDDYSQDLSYQEHGENDCYSC